MLALFREWAEVKTDPLVEGLLREIAEAGSTLEGAGPSDNLFLRSAPGLQVIFCHVWILCLLSLLYPHFALPKQPSAPHDRHSCTLHSELSLLQAKVQSVTSLFFDYANAKCTEQPCSSYSTAWHQLSNMFITRWIRLSSHANFGPLLEVVQVESLYGFVASELDPAVALLRHICVAQTCRCFLGDSKGEIHKSTDARSVLSEVCLACSRPRFATRTPKLLLDSSSSHISQDRGTQSNRQRRDCRESGPWLQKRSSSAPPHPPDHQPQSTNSI